MFTSIWILSSRVSIRSITYQFTAAAFVVHGGTIMAVMERFARPERPYYDYNVANGCGFIARFKGNDMIDYSSL